MDRNTRAYWLQRVFWTPLGFKVLELGTAFGRRWNGVVRNHSATSEVNGEHWLLQQLPDKPFVIDAGVHAGEISDAVLALRPDARIVGFEPARSSRELYWRSHAPDPRVQLESLALSNAIGEAAFYDDASQSNSLAPIPSAAHAVSYRVQTTTLDAYAATAKLPHIDLLKIDVEGYDLHVLEGASELLRAGAIDIFTLEYGYTWVHTRRYLRDAWELMRDKPYRLFRLFNGFLSPFDYQPSHERFAFTLFVGVSNTRLARADLTVRAFPD
ncbi:MAG: FkbM family methyltransferase [Polyangiales bacterium]